MSELLGFLSELWDWVRIAVYILLIVMASPWLVLEFWTNVVKHGFILGDKYDEWYEVFFVHVAAVFGTAFYLNLIRAAVRSVFSRKKNEDADVEQSQADGSED